MTFILSVLSWLLLLPAIGYTGQTGESLHATSLPPLPFSLEELHSRIDRTHPLLWGAGAEKTIARGQMLKALGAFDPTLVNDLELERFISSTDPSKVLKRWVLTTRWLKRCTPWVFEAAPGFVKRSVTREFRTCRSVTGINKSFWVVSCLCLGAL